MEKQRIAILGSGVGAITTAWALTSLPDAHDRFDITIYTLGWRLGGKGASGRNAAFGQRIEEHGLHIWMGFYDNAFKAMQECYGELDRPASCPIRSWTDAFFPHNDIVLYEFFKGQWYGWPMRVPELPGVPGTPRNEPKVVELFVKLLHWMRDWIVHPMHEPALIKLFTNWIDKGRPGWVETEVLKAESWVMNKLHPQSPLRDDSDGSAHVTWLLEDLNSAVSKIENLDAAGMDALADILGHLEKFGQRLETLAHDFVEAHHDVRWLWVLMDLAVSVCRGLIHDEVLWKGFHAMSGLDFRAWLEKHGASREARSSATVRTIYDLCFAYHDGELDSPDMDAAVLLRTLMLMGFTFRGGFMYRMRAGMGDIVFAPYYEALKKRGVTFKFFHKVTNLGVSADGQSIDTIDIDKQVTVAAGDDAYQPFVTVKNLPCWPSTPNFDQLVDGKALQQSGQNLESSECTWPPAQAVELKRGHDFDQVVLGISIGAIPGICGELIKANPQWQQMVAKVHTVETQGVQLWLKSSFKDLGWEGPPSVAGTYAEPLDTWADMTDLLAFEDWPAGSPPVAIMYLCGPLRKMIPADTAVVDAWWHVRHQQVLNVARTWVQSHMAVCLPKSAGTHNPSGLDVKWLQAPTKPDNPILDQYLRANIDPSERYVLSLAGSSSARLRGGESGFSNLALAGDWVWTPINAGCVEAATMGGLDAARKISGDDIPVFGWDNVGQPGQGDQN